MDVIAYYKELDDEEKFYKDELEKYKHNPNGKDYQKFLAAIKNVTMRRERWNLEYKKQLYHECLHIACAVDDPSWYDFSLDNRTYFKCVKCGLDERVCYDTTLYPLDECRNMWNSLCETAGTSGPHLSNFVWIHHNYEETQRLYDSMKEKNPDLTDEEFLNNCIETLKIDPSVIETYKHEFSVYNRRRKHEN